MKTKHSFVTKALSVVLTAVMMLTMLSVGFVLPDGIKASAAIVSVNSYATLNSAIQTANSASGQTTISVTSDISTTGSQNALTTITGNVILDLNGHNITFTYDNTHSREDSVICLPAGVATTTDAANQLLTPSSAMISVSSAGSLQIINSSGTDAKLLCKVRNYSDTGGNVFSSTKYWTVATASLIRTEGSLTIGSKTNSGYNNLTVKAWAIATNEKSNGDSTGYDKQRVIANAYTVTVDNASSAKFFMYGGKLYVEGVGRGNHGGEVSCQVFGLNVNSCYSTEVYGGEISVTAEGESGIKNSDATDSDSGTCRFAAIRAFSSNIYLFNVSCNVEMGFGSDTSGVSAYVYNILTSTDTSILPHIYGGAFHMVAGKSGASSGMIRTGTICSTAAAGSFQIAMNGSINPNTAFSASASLTNNYALSSSGNNGIDFNFTLNFATLMYFGDSKSNSTTTRETTSYNDGVYPWEYASFRDYITNHTTQNDLYFAESKTHIDDGSGYSAETSYKYRRVGYTQSGWYGSFNVGTENGSTTALANAGTLFLYPKWSTNNYTITYDMNIPDSSVSQPAPFSTTKNYTIESTSTLGVPTRNGYTFDGWKVTATSYPETDAYTSLLPWAKKVYYGTQSLTGMYGNISCQAQWSPVTYTIGYDMNGAEEYVSDSSYTIENTVTIPNDTITKTNYDFTDKWEVKTASGNWIVGNQYVSGTTIPAGSYGDVTLAPVFTPHIYTVQYDSDGGSNVEDENLKRYSVESTTTLPTVTKTGYSFVGWKPVTSVGSWNASDTYVAGTSFNAKYGNVSLRAIWQVQTYTVSFDLKADENYGTSSFNYAYDTSYPLTTQPTRLGYTFAGWKVKSVASGGSWVVGTVYTPDAVTGTVTIPANMQGDVVLEATWTPVTYNITFNSNGGSSVPAIAYTLEDSVILSAPVKSGYTFGGWQVSGAATGNWSGTYNAGTLTGMYGEVTLVALWNPVSYTATLNVNGGSLGSAASTITFDIESDETERKLPAPTKTGYDFVNWEVTSTPTVGSSWAVGDTYTDYLGAGKYGNVTLTANWAPVSYSIRYSTIGNAIVDKSYTIEDTFKLPTSECPGYTFNNWSVTAAAGNWTEGQTLTTTTNLSGKYGNVILTANFSPVNYTITYSYPDGTSSAVNYNVTQSVNLPTYNYGGYTFQTWKVESCTGGNWYVDAVFGAGAVEAGMYGDVTLVPVLEANTYTLTFDSDGGTAYANKSYKITDDSALPTPTKTGYDFAGWKVTTADGNWAANEVLATDAVVTGRYGNAGLTATWTPKSYTITWETGSGTFTTTADYGTTPTPDGVNTNKAEDAQYYYSFSGEWSPAITSVTGDTTYTAKYTKTLRSYTVTWVVESDESGTDAGYADVYLYGETPVYNEGETPVKASSDADDHVWRFTGWSPAIGTVTGDVTYTAQFRSVAAPRTVTWVIDGVATDTYYEVGETPDYGTTPYKPAADGYDYQFSNWTPAIVPVADGTDYTYTAVFTAVPKTYTANFNANGGVLYTDEIDFDIQAGLTLPTPTRNGYDFAGWKVTTARGTWVLNTEYAGGQEVTGKWGGVTFTAMWTIASYTVTYVTADGTAPAAFTYTIESTDVLTACTREGYEMNAYVVSAGEGSWVMGSSVTVGSAVTGMYGNVTLTPIWYTKSYNISWISGDTVQTTSVQYGDTIAAMDPVTKTGYNAAWAETIPETMPANDLTFNAVYTLINYNVRVIVSGGDPIDNFTYNIESDAVLPTPTREGSVFRGWRITIAQGSWTKNDLKPAGYSLTGKTGNITITAEWTLVTHFVTFEAGDVTKVTEWYHGSTPFYSGTPTKASDEYNSYVFTGWDREFTTVTEDTTYTAQFKATERVYTISWNVDNNIITESYSYGETPVYPGETPTKAETEQYTFSFAGWDKEITAVTEDTTYLVQWNIFTKLLGLRLDSSAEVLNPGETAILTATVFPASATVKDIVWSTNDASVATIADGKITAVAAGTTLVKVSSVDGSFNAYCVVIVKPTHTNYVSITSGGVSTTNLVGSSIQLTATVMPENAANVNVIWSSSDPSVASVNASGLVTYHKVGTATITCKAADGYATGSITVTTTEDEAQVVDEVKTYYILFKGNACGFVIDDVLYDEVSIRVVEGASIKFKLEKNKYCQIDGEYYIQESDGYYRIENIDKNYMVTTLDQNIAIPEDEISDHVDTSKTFFQRLQDFFRNIVQFFRSLFGKK